MTDPVYEPSVPKRWPVVALSRLRTARINGEIDYIKGPRHKYYYLPDVIDSFIRDYLTQRACVKDRKVIRFPREITDDARKMSGDAAAEKLMKPKRRVVKL